MPLSPDIWLPPGAYLMDGSRKSLSLSSADGWQPFLYGSERESAIALWKCVPYLYRAIDIRTNALVKLPFELFDEEQGRVVTDDEEYQGVMRHIKRLLKLTSLSLALHGRSYWLLERNSFGLNMTPRWAYPGSVTPEYDTNDGLLRFLRIVGGSQIAYPVKNDIARGLVYFWHPNPEAEVGPGPAPVEVALKSAGAGRDLIEFISSFLQKGALKQFLLLVKGNLPPEELQTTKEEYQRYFGGAARAGELGVLRGGERGVDVQVVGEGLAGLDNQSLVRMIREDIVATMGVPHSLITASAANYATAKQDKYNLYEDSVVPEAELIAETLNTQLFPEHLRLRPCPERLEIYQKDQLEEAQALGTLMEKGIMEREEAREQLGLVQPGQLSKAEKRILAVRKRLNATKAA